MAKKYRVLALADYCCATGFANVAGNILSRVYNTGEFDLDVIGINYYGDPDYDKEKFAGNVYPAVQAGMMAGPYGEPYGRQRFLDKLGTGVYDAVWILQDTFIVQEILAPMKETYDALDKKFKVVFYFPFDATPKKEWVEKVVSLVDYPVAYTEYAKRECLKIDPTLASRLDVIYHGHNFKEIDYISDRKAVKAFRNDYFGAKNTDKYIITNVNRNQSRKDIIRNFMILNELRKQGQKDIMLYLHMQHDDQGGNVLVMADHFGFKLGDDFILPNQKVFSAQHGLPVEVLNLIYNASDMILTTTLGEGWGLSITEAMAAKTPIVAPDHTSISEMIGKERGYLVKAGNTPSLWIQKELDNERLRPLVDVEDATKQIIAVKEGKVPDHTENAYKWVKSLDWDVLATKWIAKIRMAADEAQKETAFKQQYSSKPNRAERRRMGIK